MIIDELIAILGYDVRGEGELNRFNKGMERAALLAQRLAAVMVAAGTVAAGALFTFGKGIIDTSAKFEGFQTSLETIEGSAEKAKQSMDWITKFAAKTPYDLDGVTRAFIKLKTYGIDPTDGTLTTLGDTASAMNKPLDQAVEAFADATSFQFERLREFGLIANQKGNEVTFQWTKNGKTLTQVVKKNGADIQKFIKKHFGSTFNGAMLRQSKTWDGMMANLGDNWELFKKRIGDGGFFEAVKRRLGGLLDYLDKLDQNGTLDRWSKQISKGFEGTMDFAEGQFKGLIGDLQFLTGWIKMNPEWWGPIKTGLMAIGAIIFPKGAALLVLQDVLRWLQGKESLIGRFATSLSELTGLDPGTSGTVLASLATAGAAFLLFGGTFGKVASGIRSLALALGLLGGAQAAAGAGTLSTLMGGSAVFGLLSLAAAAAAAAGSMYLFWDAWNNDTKLNEAIKDKVAPGLFDWFYDNVLDSNPAESQYWKSGQGEKDNAARKARENERNRARTASANDKVERSTDYKRSSDFYDPDTDWRIEEDRKEERRARFSRWGNMAENFRHNAQRTSSANAAQAVVNDNSNRSITVNPNVQVKVEQIQQAGQMTGEKTAAAVTSALSKVPSHPTRTTPSPTF